MKQDRTKHVRLKKIRYITKTGQNNQINPVSSSFKS